MPFMIRFHENNLSGMVAQCDVCKKLVKGDEANVAWEPGNDRNHGDLHRFWIICHECDPSYKHLYATEIGQAIVHLIYNAKINMKTATRHADLCALV